MSESSKKIQEYLRILTNLYLNHFDDFNILNALDNILPHLTLLDIDLIKEKTDYKANYSLFDDLVNQEKANYAVERYFRNLDLQYKMQLVPQTTEPVSVIILKGFTDLFRLTERFEYQLRHTYIILLDDTIKKLKSQNQNEIANSLEQFKYGLFIKYSDLILDYQDYYSKRNINDSLFYETTMDDYIKKALNYSVCLPNINDIPENKIENITKLYTVQTYLRSLFTMLNDDYMLTIYNEYYNSLKNENKIIIDAFIKCEKDIKKVEKAIKKSK